MILALIDIIELACFWASLVQLYLRMQKNMLLRCLSTLFASIIAFLCVFSPAAMAAETNWTLLGHFYTNDDVSDALNNAKVGIGAAVGLNIKKTQFTVFGNTNSPIYPGYKWKSIGRSDITESELAEVANDAGAASSTVTVNSNNGWVIWGYIPE